MNSKSQESSNRERDRDAGILRKQCRYVRVAYRLLRGQSLSQAGKQEQKFHNSAFNRDKMEKEHWNDGTSLRKEYNGEVNI